MLKMLVSAAFSAAVCLGSTFASAATVGNDAIDRLFADSFNNVGTVTDITFGESGTITSWDVFIKAGSGDVALVLYDLLGTPSFDFSVAAFDRRTVSTLGFHTFTTNLDVTAGQRLGLFWTTAKVAFGSGGSTNFQSENDQFASSPFEVGAVVPDRSVGNRVYSINATVDTTPVPLPAGLPLLLGGMVVLAGLRLRRKNALA